MVFIVLPISLILPAGKRRPSVGRFGGVGRPVPNLAEGVVRAELA